MKIFYNTPFRNFATGNPDLYFPDLDLDLGLDLRFSGRRRLLGFSGNRLGRHL
jgi:hypothetical protein